MVHMALHALDDVDDAIDATRSLLLPIDIKQWLKLAFVAFFIGGPAGNSISYTVNGSGGNGGVPVLPSFPGFPTNIPRLYGLVIAITGILLVIAFLFVLVGSIMEFVFVQSIRTREIRIRKTWGERWRQGVRLFGFRLLVGLSLAALVVGLAVFVLSPIVRGPTGTGLSIALIVLLIPVAFFVGLFAALVNAFTTLFVVPIMLLEDAGVLAAWRSLWSSIRAEPTQYAAFALVGFILYIAAGIIVGVVVVIPAFVLLLPVAPIALAGLSLLPGLPIVGVLLLLVAAAIYLTALLAVVAVVQVPVLSFIRYYAMLVLGDIEPDLDPIPDIRNSIRSTA